jgi:hypothetical protein
MQLRDSWQVFYVAANEKDDWAVVDGVQRLTTIYDFTNKQARNHPLALMKYGLCLSQLGHPEEVLPDLQRAEASAEKASYEMLDKGWQKSAVGPTPQKGPLHP